MQRDAEIQPGAEMQVVHQAILRGELGPAAIATVTPVPAQLPPDIHGFTGREEELHHRIISGTGN